MCGQLFGNIQSASHGLVQDRLKSMPSTEPGVIGGYGDYAGRRRGQFVGEARRTGGPGRRGPEDPRTHGRGVWAGETGGRNVGKRATTRGGDQWAGPRPARPFRTWGVAGVRTSGEKPKRHQSEKFTAESCFARFLAAPRGRVLRGAEEPITEVIRGAMPIGTGGRLEKPGAKGAGVQAMEGAAECDSKGSTGGTTRLGGTWWEKGEDAVFHGGRTAREGPLGSSAYGRRAREYLGSRTRLAGVGPFKPQPAIAYLEEVTTTWPFGPRQRTGIFRPVFRAKEGPWGTEMVRQVRAAFAGAGPGGGRRGGPQKKLNRHLHGKRRSRPQARRGVPAQTKSGGGTTWTHA